MKEFLEGRLAVLRNQLEGDIDDRSTQLVRGRISEIKNLLSAAEVKDINTTSQPDSDISDLVEKRRSV